MTRDGGNVPCPCKQIMLIIIYIYGQYIRFQIIMYRYVQVIPVNQNLRLQTAPRAQFPIIDFLLLALNTVKKKS